jgi:hypothetical protein
MRRGRRTSTWPSGSCSSPPTATARSTNWSRLDDFKQAILLLAGLRRLHVLLGEQEPAEVIKRKIDVWKAKMEDDQRKREQELATRSLRAHKQP